MFVSKTIYQSLETMAKQNFGNNFSIIVDFLFYAFDRFPIDEKRNILRACPLLKDKKEQGTNENDQIDPKAFVEEFQITIHPLLEERLINLIFECEKLQTISDAIEFLIFVRNLIDKELLVDLIIQYSIESIQYSEFNYLDPANPEKYQSPDPSHVAINIPDNKQFLCI